MQFVLFQKQLETNLLYFYMILEKNLKPMSKQASPQYSSGDLLVTAWFSYDEFLAVFSDLFSSQSNNSLGSLCVWAARLGNKLPVASECTYSLIASQRALLNEKIPSSDAISRAASSLTRALFLLTERQQQQRAPFHAEDNARTPLPLHVLAEELGVPEWVVEIRHDSVHGRLPSRPLLLRATQLIIDAVRRNYWEPLKQQLESWSDFQSTKSDERVAFIQSTHNILNRLLGTLRPLFEHTSSSSPLSKRSRKEFSDLQTDFRALVKQCVRTRCETDLFACLLASEYSALLIEPLCTSQEPSDERREMQRELCFSLLDTFSSQKLLSAFWRQALDSLEQLCRSECQSARGQCAQSLAEALTRVLLVSSGSVSSGFEKRLHERVFTSDFTIQLFCATGAGASLQRVVRAVAHLGVRATPTADGTARALLCLLEALLQTPFSDVQLEPAAKRRLLDACRVFLRLEADTDTDMQPELPLPLDENALHQWLASLHPTSAASASASTAALSASAVETRVWRRDRSDTEWARFALGTCPSMRASTDFSQLVLCEPADSALFADADDCIREDETAATAADGEREPRPENLREAAVQRPLEMRKLEAEIPLARDFFRRVDDAIRILPT